MGLISNGTTIFDNGSMSSGFSGSMVLIKKLTASSSATLSFVDGTDGVVLDDTYKEYVFTFKDIHPASDSVDFQVNFRDGGSDYDATKTTTAFNAYHQEDDDPASLAYHTDTDLAQSTADQVLAYATGNDNDQCVSGVMHLFNPSSTTFVKHFIANIQFYHSVEYSINRFVAGYCNVTEAIDGVQFKMSSGNIDAGDICLYGIA